MYSIHPVTEVSMVNPSRFLPDRDVFTNLNLAGLNWGKLKTVGTSVFTSYFAPFSELRGIGGLERQP